MRRPYRMLGAIMLIALAMLATIPGRSLRSQVARVRFIAACASEIKQIGQLSTAGATAHLMRTLQERPHLIGVATWPYVNGLWTPTQRFAALQDHYVELESFPRLHIGTDERLPVSDLGDLVPGLTVAIDRPGWFMREGELTINLFAGDFRAYSLAFTVGRCAGERVLYVGCLQGRQADGAEQLYRDLTKQLHGWRPRDVMVSLAQMVGAAADVSRIYLVADAARVHRHPYFGQRHENLSSANYDEIWAEHGAVPVDGGFFMLDSQIVQREHHQIPSNKRAMYRRRYELMARLQRDVQSALAPTRAAPSPVRPVNEAIEA